MEDEVFRVLEQIEQGETVKPSLGKRWIPALKTVSWILETETGPRLTAAGQSALAAFKAGRRNLFA